MKDNIGTFEQHVYEGNLEQHAEYELRKAGLFDKDSDYGGMLGKAVLDIVKVFAKQGHSGFSAPYVVALFTKVANWDTLSPITNDPEEWEDVSQYFDGKPQWQNKRCPRFFSKDAGKTWWDVDEKTVKAVQESLASMAFRPIFEIGDRLVRPENLSNLEFDIKGGSYKYTFTVDGQKYGVGIKTYYETLANPYNVSVKVDFGAQEGQGEDKYTWNLTNRGNALAVISAVTWTVSFFFVTWAMKVKMQRASYANYITANLKQLVIHAKSESEGDMRRANVYEAFLRGIADRIGLNVVDVRQKQSDYTGGGEFTHTIETEYDIEPTPMLAVAELMRRGDRRIIEALSAYDERIRMWALWSDKFYEDLFMNVSDAVELTNVYRREFVKYVKMQASDELLRALKYFFNYRKGEIEKSEG